MLRPPEMPGRDLAGREEVVVARAVAGQRREVVLGARVAPACASGVCSGGAPQVDLPRVLLTGRRARGHPRHHPSVPRRHCRGSLPRLPQRAVLTGCRASSSPFPAQDAYRRYSETEVGDLAPAARVFDELPMSISDAQCNQTQFIRCSLPLCI